MLKLKGFDFLRIFVCLFVVIIILVYEEYVLESFELVVFDYFLKFFWFDCFLKVVNCVLELK